MRIDRILALSGLLVALSPLSLRAQAASAARCADGTKAESRYMACWFHGGVVVGSTAAPKPKAAAPRRAAKLTESAPTPAAHKPRAAVRPHKATSKAAAKAAPQAAHAAKPPRGATALCKDGSYTVDRKPKKGCRKHDGVARLLPKKAKR